MNQITQPSAVVKLLSFLLCCIFCSKSPIHGQELKADPVELFNKFQAFSNNKPNADSAYACIVQLAANPLYQPILTSLLHDSFALSFKEKQTEERRPKIVKSVHHDILAKLVADTHPVLVHLVRPIYLWTLAQANRNEPFALEQLAQEMIATQLADNDFYSNRTGRYAMLIYQIVVAHPDLKTTAQKLFDRNKEILQANLTNVTDTSTRQELDKRAWYRYLYASAQYLNAQTNSNPEVRLAYLKDAFEYSPDLTDQHRKSAYYYDMICLFPNDPKASFKMDYLDMLVRETDDKNEVLKVLRDIAIAEPEYKDRLKKFYEGMGDRRIPFEQYWMNAIHATAKDAPAIEIATLENVKFTLDQHKGKWILIDFWGTWCGPCREEHPALQKFYKSNIVPNDSRIALLTIACRDTEAKVKAYMKQNKYSFPVAMSNGRLEDDFQVQGYPSKFIVTPYGKYVLLPFGVDWVSFFKHYADL
jgi:thiol-disulfide isomerase/thioredoxin